MTSYNLTKVTPENLTFSFTTPKKSDNTATEASNPLGIKFISISELFSKPDAAQKSANSSRPRILSSASSTSAASLASNLAEGAVDAQSSSKKKPIVGLKGLLKKMEEDQSGRFKVERKQDGGVEVTKYKREKNQEISKGNEEDK